MKNLSGKDCNRETLCFKSETSHGSSSSSSGNASSQAVNKSIQAVAQRYCIDCKGSFDELSKITQVCDFKIYINSKYYSPNCFSYIFGRLLK